MGKRDYIKATKRKTRKLIQTQLEILADSLNQADSPDEQLENEAQRQINSLGPKRYCLDYLKLALKNYRQRFPEH